MTRLPMLIVKGHYGEGLAAQGEAVGARERLEEALAIFQRLGAPTHVETTERLLSELAAGTGSSARDHGRLTVDAILYSGSESKGSDG